MSKKATTQAPADVAAEFVAKYAAAAGPAKAAVKREVNEAAKAAIMAGDADLARALIEAEAAMVPAKKAAAEIDYAEVILDRAAALVMAAMQLAHGLAVPAGIDAKHALDVDFAKVTERAERAFGSHGGDAAEEHAEIVKAANRLATAKITRSGERNSIQDVVDRAFDGLDAGTFLRLSEVSARGALGDYKPSDGALAARTDWDALTTTLRGVEPVPASGNVGRGYRKI